LQRLNTAFIDCKNKQNDRNFGFIPVNNCYCSGIIMCKDDFQKERNVLFATYSRQPWPKKAGHTLRDRPR
jgi:hypothetical protein